MAVHIAESVSRGNELAAVQGLRRRLERSGQPGEGPRREELWQRAWGPRRRVDWVGTLAGRDDESGARRSREVTQFAFNLPGPPYVLLCTKIAREGIDLHLWCYRVVLYDLEWNPALLEQEIGRIDRIGSLSRRKRRPLEVIWTVTPGSYEEYMKQAVERRLDLMKVLLGAGEWLASSPETQERLDDLERYRLDFSP